MKNSILAILLLSLTSCGHTEGIAIKGEASNSCAPWDGRSILIKLDIENKTDIFMDIWGGGIRVLTWGGNVSLKENGDHASDGRFRYCAKGTIQCTSASVWLRDVKFSDDKQIEGEFIFNKKNYKFTAPFNNKEHAMCG